jgi:type VI secretion system secreted protein Hcp
MAADIFAKIGDIQGDSVDAKHKGEIDVLSWSWGVSQSGSIGTGGGGGSGKASFQDFQITHGVDRASPSLLKACATGQHIPEATITGVHPGSAPGAPGLVENVSLQFGKVDLEYRPQKPDGSLDTGIHFKYDIKNNREG